MQLVKRAICTICWTLVQYKLVCVRLSRDSLATQLEASLTKADSEQLARSIAEEQYSDLEKEKIMKELEIKDMIARHRQELGEKDNTINSVRIRDLSYRKLPGSVQVIIYIIYRT